MTCQISIQALHPFRKLCRMFGHRANLSFRILRFQSGQKRCGILAELDEAQAPICGGNQHPASPGTPEPSAAPPRAVPARGFCGCWRVAVACSHYEGTRQTQPSESCGPSHPALGFRQSIKVLCITLIESVRAQFQQEGSQWAGRHEFGGSAGRVRRGVYAHRGGSPETGHAV